MNILMKCGHSAQGTNQYNKPVCVICLGIKKGADEVAETPFLDGRQAECVYCKNTKPSSIELPFFEHRSFELTDTYYCGCYGWD